MRVECPGLHGENYRVRAEIAQVYGASAHADRSDLMRWLSNLKEALRQTMMAGYLELQSLARAGVGLHPIEANASSDQEVSLPATSAESQWFDSAQLLLSEKRTALSVLRTGSGIFVLPLSVLSVLIATAKNYSGQPVSHLLISVLALCGGLAILSIFLIVRSLRHIFRYDRMLHELEISHPVLGDLID